MVVIVGSPRQMPMSNVAAELGARDIEGVAPHRPDRGGRKVDRHLRGRPPTSSILLRRTVAGLALSLRTRVSTLVRHLPEQEVDHLGLAPPPRPVQRGVIVLVGDGDVGTPVDQ